MAHTPAYFHSLSNSTPVRSFFLWYQFLGLLRISMAQNGRKKRVMETCTNMAGESDMALELVLEKGI